MATLVLSVVGFAVAGPVGAAIGAGIGSRIDSSLFGTKITREGPRLSDLKVQSSAYGAPIPLGFGRLRLAGNVIWSTGLIETRKEEKSRAGGKGGGGASVTNVSFSYSASFAVALAGRRAIRVDRIWADGKLIRNPGGPLSVGGGFRFYPGDEAQLPDPLIEALEGEAPAFRGIAYILFEDLQLAEFANRIPNLSFELVAEDGAVTLAAIIGDLMARADPLLGVDVPLVAPPIAGYGVTPPASVREALEPLAGLHPFQVVERGRRLRFLDPAISPQFSFDDGDLAADGRLRITRIEDWQLPHELAVHYLDQDRDYQANVQRARRLTSGGARVDNREFAMAIGAADAKRAAERGLCLAWTAREQLSFAVGRAQAAVEAGDFVAVAQNGVSYRLIAASVNHDAGLIRIAGSRFDPADLDNDADADGGAPISQSIVVQGPTSLHLLDLPLLPGSPRDATRFYAAAAGASPGWRFASLFEASDGGVEYGEVARLSSPAVIGTTLAALDPASANLWDRASILDVKLLDDAMILDSRPQLAILNGGNAALVGDEIIQFTTAELTAPGQYRLRGLLRGRLATDAAIGNHQPGERFVLLASPGLVAVDTLAAAIGQSRLYKAAGAADSLAALPSQDFTYGGRNLQPLAPAHPTASRDGAGSLSLGWIRRSRTGLDWLDGADAPLAEESERYTVEILNAGALVRVIVTTTPSLVYDAGQQIADFGAVQPQIMVRIFQLSAVVGRGAALIAVV